MEESYLGNSDAVSDLTQSQASCGLDAVSDSYIKQFSFLSFFLIKFVSNLKLS